MSWLLNLYNTYENCKSIAGDMPTDGKAPLLPQGHITTNAHIEITIDEDGNFKWASVIDKDEAVTIIPCTESSSGRTSGEAPHPLCDKLQYIAADYKKYVGEKRYYHQSYLELLSGWCNSEFSHWKARSVLRYIEKGTVIEDLVAHGVLHLGSDEKLIKKWKREYGEDKPKIFAVFSGGDDQTGAFIRWNVTRIGDPESAVWKDKSLFESWSKYSNSIMSNEALCYISGKVAPSSTNHPKYIRYSGDGAKLISSNDKTNFTFRGRFETDKEACTISYEISQKAHYVLKWLISKQGYKNDSQVIVAWSVAGTDIPSPTDDSFELCGTDAEELDSTGNLPFTAEQFAHKLNQRIAGYRASLASTDRIVVMGLDSATPGRMSVIFYRELSGSDFLERVNSWHNTCSWIHTYKYIPDKDKPKKMKRVTYYGAPAPRDIVEATYGSGASDSLKKATIERLLPCIVDGRPIPTDIVQSAVRRASNRVGFKEDWEYNKALSIACALYRKFKEKEEYKVALENDRKTRDYLYGRLLAVAEVLESSALKENDEKRLTNAERLMQRFADRPYSTWRTIELSLAPSKARLGGRSIRYEKILQEIMNLFDPEDFTNDRKLSGEFLLGYHCQKSALYAKNQQNDENDENQD